mgnify:CR=1 FL=1
MVGVFRWQRSDGVLISQHIVAQRLFVYHRCLLVVDVGGKQYEEAAHGEYLKQDYGFIPLSAKQDMEYRFGACCEQQQQSKDKIGGEAGHLAHGAQQRR